MVAAENLGKKSNIETRPEECSVCLEVAEMSKRSGRYISQTADCSDHISTQSPIAVLSRSLMARGPYRANDNTVVITECFGCLSRVGQSGELRSIHTSYNKDRGERAS